MGKNVGKQPGRGIKRSIPYAEGNNPSVAVDCNRDVSRPSRLLCFQAAAVALNKSHPSIFAAVGALEKRLGLELLDRRGYRVCPTEAGRSFHERSRLVLRDVENLGEFSKQLASGEEALLRIVIGDLVPRDPVLQLLSSFFAERTRTRLHVDYEAVSGPHERLREGEASLVFHRLVVEDPAFEQMRHATVTLLPVVAPGFLPFALSEHINPEQMATFTQCIIRDTARHSSEDYFLFEGAHHCSVADHAMKRELIRHGLAWGHLPTWLIQDDLKAGRLLCIAGRYLNPFSETIGVLRSSARPHGPVADALWRILQAKYRNTALRPGGPERESE